MTGRRISDLTCHSKSVPAGMAPVGGGMPTVPHAPVLLTSTFELLTSCRRQKCNDGDGNHEVSTGLSPGWQNTVCPARCTAGFPRTANAGAIPPPSRAVGLIGDLFLIGRLARSAIALPGLARRPGPHPGSCQQAASSARREPPPPVTSPQPRARPAAQPVAALALAVTANRKGHTTIGPAKLSPWLVKRAGVQPVRVSRDGSSRGCRRWLRELA